MRRPLSALLTLVLVTAATTASAFVSPRYQKSPRESAIEGRFRVLEVTGGMMIGWTWEVHLHPDEGSAKIWTPLGVLISSGTWQQVGIEDGKLRMHVHRDPERGGDIDFLGRFAADHTVYLEIVESGAKPTGGIFHLERID